MYKQTNIIQYTKCLSIAHNYFSVVYKWLSINACVWYSPDCLSGSGTKWNKWMILCRATYQKVKINYQLSSPVTWFVNLVWIRSAAKIVNSKCLALSIQVMTGKNTSRLLDNIQSYVADKMVCPILVSYSAFLIPPWYRLKVETSDSCTYWKPVHIPNYHKLVSSSRSRSDTLV